jgi:hypothetical protein
MKISGSSLVHFLSYQLKRLVNSSTTFIFKTNHFFIDSRAFNVLWIISAVILWYTVSIGSSLLANASVSNISRSKSRINLFIKSEPAFLKSSSNSRSSINLRLFSLVSLSLGQTFSSIIFKFDKFVFMHCITMPKLPYNP